MICLTYVYMLICWKQGLAIAGNGSMSVVRIKSNSLLITSPVFVPIKLDVFKHSKTKGHYESCL